MINAHAVDKITEHDHYSELPRGDGVIVISPDRRVMSANLQAEKLLMTRIDPGQVFNMAGILSGEHMEKIERTLETALVNGLAHENLEVIFSSASGASAILIFSVNPIFDKDKKITGAVLTFRHQPSNSGPYETENENLFVGFDTLFDQMAEGVFTINSRWRITTFNRRAQEITGFSREEVLGNYCWDIFSSDLCKSNCPLKRAIETGNSCMDQDIRIAVKDNRSQSIIVNTSAIRNNRNRIVGAIETFRPLTPAAERDETSDKSSSYLDEIIGESPHIKKIHRLLPDIAATEAAVIIEGEPGTGKELVARAIHQQSKRSGGPFVSVNCSALSGNLLESELFGHAKDAFTGAANARVGKLELSKGGTLFLDEVGEIKPETQIKLLRVLEERVFERVAGIRTIPMDTRIIAATNKNLAVEVREGRFREDLYYRLRTVPLYLPPLRERKSDIPLLINHYVTKFNKKYDKKVKRIDSKSQKILTRFSWPGNVRELERIIEYAFVFVKGPVITQSHLPEIGDITATATPEHSNYHLLEEEKTSIENVLKKTKGRRDDASRILGISRTSLWRKMKTHGLL